MTSSTAVTWARHRAGPPKTWVRHWIKRALSLFSVDLERDRRTQFYHDVLRLGVVSGTGYTTVAYGLAWDNDLSPVWQFPSPTRGADLPEPDEGGVEIGRPVRDAALIGPQWMARAVNPRAA